MDRWHPSNVEWPDFDRKGPLDIELDNHPEPGYRRVPTLPLESYEALYADRGRVLAAARELADRWDNGDDCGAGCLDVAADDLRELLDSFREVDQ